MSKDKSKKAGRHESWKDGRIAELEGDLKIQIDVNLKLHESSDAGWAVAKARLEKITEMEAEVENVSSILSLVDEASAG